MKRLYQSTIFFLFSHFMLLNFAQAQKVDIEELLACQEALRTLGRSFSTTVDSFENVINNLNLLIDSPPTVTTTPSTDPTPSTVSDCSRYETEIDRLRADLRSARNLLSEVREQNRSLEREVTNLSQNINDLQNDLNRTNNDLDAARDSLYAYKSVVDSLEAAKEAERLRRLNALTNLNAANQEFHRYWYLKDTRSPLPDTAAERIVRLTWSVYQRHSDYLRGQEHLNTYRMVKNNPFGIIDSLGSDLNAKVNARNEQMLTNLGKALELGPDSVYTIAMSEIEILAALVVPERNINSGQVVSAIKGIYSDYKEKSYAQAVNTYNKIHSLFETSDLKKEGTSIEVNEARYAAASTVLWNRGNVNKLKDVYPKGSWAHSALQNRIAREEAGKALLKQVINESPDPKLKRKAAIALGKFYRK